MDKLCDLGLEKWDKSKNYSAPGKVIETSKTSVPMKSKTSKAHIRRQVWQRDKGECQICKAQHAIEIDHRIPKAMGGEDSIENLRLLCRACNQREAIKVYGQQKMDLYINHI